MPLCEKYAPTTLLGIVGNTESINKIMEYGLKAQEGKKPRPLMIFGPPGTGKTAAAHALAYSHGFEILELDSSDTRSNDVLSRKMLPAASSSSLFGKKTLILLDEIDELSSSFDSGADKAILALIKTSKHPIIFIANDFWNQKIAFLREYVDKCEFKKLKPDEVLHLLKNVLKREGKEMDEQTLGNLVKRSNGDARSALNDLETMMDASPDSIDALGIRNRKTEIFNVLDKIFSSMRFEPARNSIMNADIEIEMLLNWISENIPNRYSAKESLAGAFHNAAISSKFIGNAKRKNYYGYYRYASIHMSSGVALANEFGRTSSLKPYTFPARIKYMSMTKKDRNLSGQYISKLIYQLHAHKKDISEGYVPMLNMLVNMAMKEFGEEKTYDFFEYKYGMGKAEVDAIKDKRIFNLSSTG